MLGYEAKAKVLAAKSGDKQVELDSIEEQMKRLEDAGQNQMSVTTVSSTITSSTYNAVRETDYGKLYRQAESLRKEMGRIYLFTPDSIKTHPIRVRFYCSSSTNVL